MGDFRGLRSKLDYLQWLGIDCIWLLPFYPSPLKDGGYDISDFLTVSPEFGTVDEFASFVESAHERGMRVITDFVMNHTSSEHPWFQESRLGPDSPKADWYVWSDTVHRYEDARIIFVDSEQSNWTYDAQREAYYWHRFYHHQPDLNYENPEVGEAMLDALRFWLDLGLDGFRLDAVPYLFEAGGHELREPAADPRVPEAGSRGGRRGVLRPCAARRGEPVARGRRRLLRGRGRVPHGVPLPRHAADVHGAPARGGAPDRRDPRPHAADPRRTASGASSCATTTS